MPTVGIDFLCIEEITKATTTIIIIHWYVEIVGGLKLLLFAEPVGSDQIWETHKYTKYFLFFFPFQNFTQKKIE